MLLMTSSKRARTPALAIVSPQEGCEDERVLRKQLESAQNELESTKAELESTKNELESTKRAFEKAQRENERERRDAERKFAEKSDAYNDLIADFSAKITQNARLKTEIESLTALIQREG